MSDYRVGNCVDESGQVLFYVISPNFAFLETGLKKIERNAIEYLALDDT
jgi:hypothetical protein